MTISPDGTPGNERAEGGSGVLLSDGRIIIFNGGHTGDGAKRAYVYNPYTDNLAVRRAPPARRRRVRSTRACRACTARPSSCLTAR